jgi:hypothetical protein
MGLFCDSSGGITTAKAGSGFTGGRLAQPASINPTKLSMPIARRLFIILAPLIT